MCEARLHDGDLVCTREDPHEPHRGCIYRSNSASDAGDGHTATEAMDT